MEGSSSEPSPASSPDKRLDSVQTQYGCKHYRRRCKIRAPCCNQIFPCRHCHNDAMSKLGNPKDRHELIRHDVREVICSVCNTEQEVARVCSSCGVTMGEYFCEVCKFYDDDTEKGQFHCNECGICRVGGREKFFHCEKCEWHPLDKHMKTIIKQKPGSCYSVDLHGKHSCVENSMRHHCPICYEYLFDSLKDTTVLKCGHTMHHECFLEMMKRDQYSCPICSKSVIDMTKYWKRMDEEVQATIMPEDYRDKKVWILCNDCNATTQANFHIIGQKCSHCSSYNTRTITRPVAHQ